MPNNDNSLKRAARYNDALAEEVGLPGTCAHLGLDMDELLHVCKQRALRAVLTEDGRGAELVRSTAANRPTAVRVSDAEAKRIDSYTAVYMDGIALGYRAAKEDLSVPTN